MFDYHLSFSNGIFYVFAFDEYKRPAGRYKSPNFYSVIKWITDRENIESKHDFGFDDNPIYTISILG